MTHNGHNPILVANRHRVVPAWVHEIAAQEGATEWAGRNDCPTHIAQRLLETHVSTPRDGADWYEQRRRIQLAGLLVGRTDVDYAAIADAAISDVEREITLAVQTKAEEIPHIVPEGSWNDREYTRIAKYLVALNAGKKVAMTNAEWLAGRAPANDALRSLLAFNVVKLGDKGRLLVALRRVANESPLARADLGYLCRHDGPHTGDECLYEALKQYDATVMLRVAPEWTVGWLDALEPEVRVIALAVIQSGAKGTSVSDVAAAAAAVAAV